MDPEIVLRYLHFISIFIISGVLISEHLLLKRSLTREEIGRLAGIDAVYGLAALTLIAAGLTLWLGGFGKPAVYYSKNWIFHLKLACFLSIGLISIYPTVFFIRNRKGDQNAIVTVPASIVCLSELSSRCLPSYRFWVG